MNRARIAGIAGARLLACLATYFQRWQARESSDPFRRHLIHRGTRLNVRSARFSWMSSRQKARQGAGMIARAVADARAPFCVKPESTSMSSR